MANTVFPGAIDSFPQMVDMLASDGALVQQYQIAMQSGNLSMARQILQQIPNNQNKIITADYLNKINDALVAVETYFQRRYSPAYVVSEQQPTGQVATDFWFQVTTDE